MEEKMNPSPDREETVTKAMSNEEKMLSDIQDIRSLFPNLSPEDVPEEVWKKVEEGESLAASYALYHLKQEQEARRVSEKNAENEKKAIPRISQEGAEEEYFSPETVRAMSADEVRKHYAAILKSMDSWK